MLTKLRRVWLALGGDQSVRSLAAYAAYVAVAFVLISLLDRAIEQVRAINITPMIDVGVHSNALKFEIATYVDLLSASSEASARRRARNRVISRLHTVSSLSERAISANALSPDFMADFRKLEQEITTLDIDAPPLSPQAAETIRDDTGVVVAQIHLATETMAAFQTERLRAYASYTAYLASVLAILGLVVIFLIMRLRRRNRILAHLATVDALTGLPSRRFADERAAQLSEEAFQRSKPVSVAVIDIDHFKRVNDTFGHLVGDRVIAAAARGLIEMRRSPDLVARMGGEEFLMVMPDTGATEAVELCERVRDAVQRHTRLSSVAVTASVGVATSDGSRRTTFRDLYRHADEALYLAKNAGRDRVVSAGGLAAPGQVNAA